VNKRELVVKGVDQTVCDDVKNAIFT